ncbi:putative bifunctional diguanylate cyclase/phosphodiesterase [Arenibaculum pallidiluteum]|uniref:putative bifunctional diguanylate cyclase/phosphodiesterase n=1 Tax=Arenibaculum pallidiluteum TaxID=2812559 RepID=UPI001A959CB5|nr:EAL domain-containing protein [Arenibaculum pallidiluteum]
MVRNPERRGASLDDAATQPVAVIECGPSATFLVLTANESFAALLGLVPSTVVGRRLGELAGQVPAARPLAELLAAGIEAAALLPMGPGVLRCEPLPPEPDGRRLVVVTGQDETASEAAAPPDDAALQALFAGAPFGIAIGGADGRLLQANPALWTWLGASETDTAGRRLLDVLQIEERSGVEAALDDILSGQTRTWRGEVRLRPGAGSGRVVRARLSAWTVPGSPAEGSRAPALVLTLEDLTDSRRAEAEARRAARYDPVTGLPGRPLFLRRVADALARADGRPASLVAIGFERLPALLLALEPTEAERLALSVVDRIRQHAGPRAVLGQLGDGVFGAVLPDADTPEAAEAALSRLAEAFARPLSAEGGGLVLTPTLGAGLHPRDAADAAGLIRTAGAALERARGRPTRRWALYEPRMAGAALARMTLEGKLRRAIERGDLELHYQPQAETTGLAVTGFEALVRWRDADTGSPVPPSEFIPVAEESGLILPLGEWVLGEACRQIAAWRTAGLPLVPVSVNLSGRQLADPLLCQKALDALARYGVAPEHLKIELTETALFGSSGGDREALAQLHEAGVRLLLDDFGTGYSSLSYLKRFPIEALKIDRSFVHGMTEDPDSAVIVQATINMAHALGMRVVAEGVETPEELTFLRAYRCDQVQGYLIAKPLPAAEVAAMLHGPTG